MYLKWLDQFGEYLRVEHSKVEQNGIPEIGVIFDLEVLHDGMGRDTKLCIYHLEEKYERINKPQGHPIIYSTCKGLFIPKEVKTWGYTFNCPDGKLEEICRYRDNFTEEEFEWGPSRNLCLTFPKILPGQKDRVIRLAKGLREEIDSRYQRAALTTEQKKYHLFLRAFNHIN